MTTFSVIRKTPQEAAAAFLNAHVENCHQMFVDLERELSSLPELGEANYRASRKEIRIPCKAKGSEQDHEVFKGQFGDELRVAITTAVRVWAFEALRDKSGRLPDPDIECYFWGAPHTLLLQVEVELF